jgi:hypothetical protein
MAKEFRPCAIDNCNGNSHTSSRGNRGYCCSHYNRLRKHGNPLGGKTSNGDPMRFIRDVALRHSSEECLPWPFGKTSLGYGTINVNGKMEIASRYVCELVNGPPPTPEHQASHSCGKGHEGCITPGHLSWKTRKENKDDELTHGTRNRGGRNGGVKLTQDDVREIISLKGVELRRMLAHRFGVSPGCIGAIQRGESWAWLSSGQPS